jgi:pimeloyl-ACP methyl ester carboxylesterase
MTISRSKVSNSTISQAANSHQAYQVRVGTKLLVQVKAAYVPEVKADCKADVLYVHGATFASALSLFFPFDNRSWADALNEAGFNAWGFDFVGYGQSSRYPNVGDKPRGGADEALPQLVAVIEHIRSLNGAKPISLIAHSWGTVVAARAAIAHADWISNLVLFGAPVMRREAAQAPQVMQAMQALHLPPLHPVNMWEQYRRFIQDVPSGHAPVLLDRHIEAWARAYLASDPSSDTRMPRSVMTPTGPIADIGALWEGQALYEPTRLRQALLFVRGEWDSVCDDADAQRFMQQLRMPTKHDVKIPKGTHLMHLEESRLQLHEVVNQFLCENPS